MRPPAQRQHSGAGGRFCTLGSSLAQAILHGTRQPPKSIMAQVGAPPFRPPARPLGLFPTGGSSCTPTLGEALAKRVAVNRIHAGVGLGERKAADGNEKGPPCIR